MSAHIGNLLGKTLRYVVRIKPEDAQWMSVLSHNTKLSDLDSIFTTGLVPGGYVKDSHDVHMSSTCRFFRIQVMALENRYTSRRGCGNESERGVLDVGAR